jgi:periplasmic protein TonB
MFQRAAHDLLGSITVAAMLAVSAPALSQTPEPDVRAGPPDASASSRRNVSLGDAPPAPSELERTMLLTTLEHERLTWERSLSAHIEHFKAYPGEAAGAGGEATVVFQIDRRGRVLKSGIAQSSGSSVLDEETLA